jgi:DNA-binding transcriptional LysR family regulator
MMDLRRLQVLRVVQQTGTVTAAAGALHLTPSAVSQQIRQLARELGVTLLEPHGRGVRLTPAACLLLDRAATLHVQWERIRAELAERAEGAVGTLRMCGFPTAVAGLLAPAGGRLSADGLDVRISEAETGPAFDHLLVDEADIAVVIPETDGPTLDDPRFDQWPLVDEPQDLLVPEGHPLAGRPGVRLGDAAHERWINAAPGGCHQHQLIAAACSAAGFVPDVAHLAADWAAESALVANGLGVTLIPRMAAVPAEHPVVRVPLSGKPLPTRQIVVCVRRGSDAQPAIARGLAALRAVAATHAGAVVRDEPVGV